MKTAYTLECAFTCECYRGEIRDDDNFKCPDFADTNHNVKEFAKFIIDKAPQAKIRVADIPDYVAEFTRAAQNTQNK